MEIFHATFKAVLGKITQNKICVFLAILKEISYAAFKAVLGEYTVIFNHSL